MDLSKMEASIVDLLQNSPIMPPVLLVRARSEDLLTSGRTTSTNNLELRLASIDLVQELNDPYDATARAEIVWEVLLQLRDLQGHTSAYPLIDTILFLLTGFVPLSADRAMIPQSVTPGQMNEDKFRNWIITLKTGAPMCEMWYTDPCENPPSNCGKNWDGRTSRGYNHCFRRVPISDRLVTYYNSCEDRGCGRKTNKVTVDLYSNNSKGEKGIAYDGDDAKFGTLVINGKGEGKSEAILPGICEKC